MSPGSAFTDSVNFHNWVGEIDSICSLPRFLLFSKKGNNPGEWGGHIHPHGQASLATAEIFDDPR
jgi:hypothetical protein